MNSDMYQISVNREQARIISEATNLYSRILMGQLEEISWLTPHFKQDGEPFDAYMVRKDTIKILMDAAKRLFTKIDHPGSNFGIHNEKIPDSARIAYDIHQVVRQQVYRDDNPDMEGLGKWSVYNDDPRLTSITCRQLAKIERTNHDQP